MSACPGSKSGLYKTYRRENGDLVRPVDNIDMVVADNEIRGSSWAERLRQDHVAEVRCRAGATGLGEILINGQVVFSSRTRSSCRRRSAGSA